MWRSQVKKATKHKADRIRSTIGTGDFHWNTVPTSSNVVTRSRVNEIMRRKPAKSTFRRDSLENLPKMPTETQSAFLWRGKFFGMDAATNIAATAPRGILYQN